MIVDTSVPVVVVHRRLHADLAIARTLGRLGVPVYLVAQELWKPVSSSRYWAKRTTCDFSRPEEESVGLLLEIGAQIQAIHSTRPILLTATDWLAVFIERNSNLLQKHFLFPHPDRPILRSLLNKWEMHLLAQEHRLPTPATASPASLDEVDEFLETTPFPIVMKAADRYAVDPPSTKMIFSRQELKQEVNHRLEAARVPNFVLQEYIPGGTDTVWMCNGYFGADPDHAVTFTGKKLRQVSETGIASLAICLPNETVATQTERLMRGVGYRGCVGVGHRYDRRDGLYKLLDVNARVSAVFRLFAGTNQMDVVRMCYLDLTGQSVPDTALQPGRKWMLESDFAAAMSAVTHGRLTPADWIRSVRGVKELHWLAADDPVPFFFWLGHALRRTGRHAARRRTKSLTETYLRSERSGSKVVHESTAREDHDHAVGGEDDSSRRRGAASSASA